MKEVQNIFPESSYEDIDKIFMNQLKWLMELDVNKQSYAIDNMKANIMEIKRLMTQRQIVDNPDDCA